MNLGDPELELLDPSPNVHALFIQFDKIFFWTKLASRAVVRWSKRMYSCAGVCSYEGRGGLCDIALSEPLLKLRPRKDLVETLLHEMIHAFLFVTCRDQDRDGHGPNFKAHMYRINQAARLNISIYHDFHEEVELYQTHWWRCNGPCQLRKPHFGIVRKSMNRAPGPSDYWWNRHQKICGGTFVKFKEPEKPVKKTAAPKQKGDIMKYINKGSTKVNQPNKPLQNVHTISDTTKVPAMSNGITKSNSSNTVVVTQKGNVVGKTNTTPIKPFLSGNVKDSNQSAKKISPSINVIEQVRNIWANKKLTPSTMQPVSLKAKINSENENNNHKPSKHKADAHIDSPPAKVKKIDDYFRTTATSLLKDIYGTNIEIIESKDTNKLIAVNNQVNSKEVRKVDCPICFVKVIENEINKHLDECLNKDVIDKICKSNEEVKTHKSVEVESTAKIENNPYQIAEKPEMKQILKEIVGNITPIPAFKGKIEILNEPIGINKKSFINKTRGTFSGIKIEVDDYTPKPGCSNDVKNCYIIKKESDEPVPTERIININKQSRKSDNYLVNNKAQEVKSGNTPLLLFEDTRTNNPPIKVEPVTVIDTALTEQKCPCCGNKVNKAIEEHLEECLAFFGNNATTPDEGASTSFVNDTIIIDDDDDDIFDESQIFNATGTKLPCPCCMQMVEQDDMNKHLDNCLS